VGLGGIIALMGELEQLHKYFNDQDPSISDREVSQSLDDIMQEIRRDWKSYKLSRLMLHGEEVRDNGFEMLLVYLIKQGFFDHRR